MDRYWKYLELEQQLSFLPLTSELFAPLFFYHEDPKEEEQSKREKLMIESVTKDVIFTCQLVQREWVQSQKQCMTPLSVFRLERLKVIGV